MDKSHILLALLTGFVQGVIEWLPVSSKTMNLLILSAGGISGNQPYALGLIANFGSFFAAFVYFRAEIGQMIKGLRHPLSKEANARLLLFVTWRFEWRFALAATVGVLNSAFFVFCMFSIFKYEIDVTFIAAILTVIGYSVNDTIVVFDRIRENLHTFQPETFKQLASLVNQSIWQVLRRSIYTVLTVVTGALSLYYFGAEPLQAFSYAIFLGLLCGAYSSIFIAVPVWLSLKKQSFSTSL